MFYLKKTKMKIFEVTYLRIATPKAIKEKKEVSNHLKEI